MTEDEHITAVLATSRAHARAEQTERGKMAVRDAAIAAALDDGVSAMALAIAVDTTQSNVWYCRDRHRGLVRRAEPKPTSITLGVHVINADYPCGHGRARFTDDDNLDPSATLRRTCRNCGTSYTVTREILASTSRGRIDKLSWEATQ